MHLCYVDEAGHTSPIDTEHADQPPLFALIGITVPLSTSKNLTWDFLQMKKTYEPSLKKVRLSELVEFELKGSSLRRDLRRPTNRRAHRRAYRIIDDTLTLLEENGCQVIGKVVTKQLGDQLKDSAVYSPAVRDLATSLESLCAASSTNGALILDSRTKTKNSANVNGITSQRFKSGGDPFPHLVEAPVFGHSDSHVPLQIADIVASALVFPVACAVYCSDYTWNAHVRPEYLSLRERFGSRLQGLEYRYVASDGRRRGGFQVEDRIAHRPSHLLLRAEQKGRPLAHGGQQYEVVPAP